MNCIKTILVTGLIVAVPSIVQAGILDVFGIGTVAKSISDTTWKIYLIKTLASMGPLVLLLASIAGIIVIAWAVIRLGDGFSETIRSVLRDGEVKTSEKWIIAFQTAYTVPAIGGLVIAGGILGAILFKGTIEIMTYTPPAVADIQAVKGK